MSTQLRTCSHHKLTFPTTTAAQIMFANPNSVEDKPTICPRMFSHPTTQPTIARCLRGTNCADAVYLRGFVLSARLHMIRRIDRRNSQAATGRERADDLSNTGT